MSDFFNILNYCSIDILKKIKNFVICGKRRCGKSYSSKLWIKEYLKEKPLTTIIYIRNTNKELGNAIGFFQNIYQQELEKEYERVEITDRIGSTGEVWYKGYEENTKGKLVETKREFLGYKVSLEDVEKTKGNEYIEAMSMKTEIRNIIYYFDEFETLTSNIKNSYFLFEDLRSSFMISDEVDYISFLLCNKTSPFSPFLNMWGMDISDIDNKLYKDFPNLKARFFNVTKAKQLIRDDISEEYRKHYEDNENINKIDIYPFIVEGNLVKYYKYKDIIISYYRNYFNRIVVTTKKVTRDIDMTNKPLHFLEEFIEKSNKFCFDSEESYYQVLTFFTDIRKKVLTDCNR